MLIVTETDGSRWVSIDDLIDTIKIIGRNFCIGLKCSDSHGKQFPNCMNKLGARCPRWCEMETLCTILDQIEDG